MLTVDQLSRLYRIQPIDYEWGTCGISQNRGDWLLVAAGSGAMMAVMDAEPRFRWCIDIDGIKDPGARLDQWLIGMEHLTGRIAVVGGWAVTRPDSLADALRALRRPVLVYPITVQDREIFRGLEQSGSMGEFLSTLQAAESLAPVDVEGYRT